MPIAATDTASMPSDGTYSIAIAETTKQPEMSAMVAPTPIRPSSPKAGEDSRRIATSSEADDLDPVAALAGRVFLQQAQRAVGFDRVDRDRVRLLAAHDHVLAGRVDAEAARLRLGLRGAEVGQLAGRAVDAHRANLVAGA